MNRSAVAIASITLAHTHSFVFVVSSHGKLCFFQRPTISTKVSSTEYGEEENIVDAMKV